MKHNAAVLAGIAESTQLDSEASTGIMGKFRAAGKTATPHLGTRMA